MLRRVGPRAIFTNGGSFPIVVEMGFRRCQVGKAGKYCHTWLLQGREHSGLNIRHVG